MALPAVVVAALTRPEERRQDLTAAQEGLAELGVHLPASFREFYEQYRGAFASEAHPFALLDLCEAPPTILQSTRTCRRIYGWPDKFIVLTGVMNNTVLVLDAETDRVFRVDFGGDDDELVAGTLQPTWPSFDAFLTDYFG